MRCLFDTALYHSMYMCVCVHASMHLCLGYELCDLLAGIERCHLHVSHTPVGPARGIQDLVMFLQDFTETSEVQVLWTTTGKQLLNTHTRKKDWKVYLIQTNCCRKQKAQHQFL